MSWNEHFWYPALGGINVDSHASQSWTQTSATRPTHVFWESARFWSTSIDFINSVAVTKEDLLVVADDIAEHHDDEDASFEPVAYCIAQRFAGQPQKAGAVFTRMQALARYVGAVTPRGWTPSETKNAVLLSAGLGSTE